ncbi:MAG: hypothetical protein GTN40_00295 [Candidatus Aenigmarchaeota archaeon]|nr:hypothetical protein [Candidatus Aenigmarchaeota archaeon]
MDVARFFAKITWHRHTLDGKFVETLKPPVRVGDLSEEKVKKIGEELSLFTKDKFAQIPTIQWLLNKAKKQKKYGFLAKLKLDPERAVLKIPFEHCKIEICEDTRVKEEEVVK